MNFKLLIVLAGLGLLVAGLVLNDAPERGSTSSSFAEKIKEFFGGSSPEMINRTSDSTVSGRFSYSSADLSVENLDSISIVKGTGTVKVAGTSIDSTKEIVVEGFRGKVGLGDNITITGNADNVTVGDIIFKDSSFDASGINASDVEFSKVREGELSAQSSQGFIVLNSNITLKLSGEDVAISDFAGSLSLGREISMSGNVGKVHVDGDYSLSFKG